MARFYANENFPPAGSLTPRPFRPLLTAMNATLSADGRIVIPDELRASAELKPGDTLDVHLYKGTIVLRKHQPLTPEQCGDLLERSRARPDARASAIP